MRPSFSSFAYGYHMGLLRQWRHQAGCRIGIISVLVDRDQCRVASTLDAPVDILRIAVAVVAALRGDLRLGDLREFAAFGYFNHWGGSRGRVVPALILTCVFSFARELGYASEMGG